MSGPASWVVVVPSGCTTVLFRLAAHGFGVRPGKQSHTVFDGAAAPDVVAGAALVGGAAVVGEPPADDFEPLPQAAANTTNATISATATPRPEPRGRLGIRS